MSRSLYDVCDIILKDLLTKDDKRIFRGSSEYYASIGVNNSEVVPAINQLLADGYLKEGKFWYTLLPIGEDFAKKGGYKGAKEAEEAMHVERLSIMQLEKLVSKSTLEVNKSVLETNESVRKLNDFTIDSLRHQRITTYVSLAIAALAIVLTILQMFFS